MGGEAAPGLGAEEVGGAAGQELRGAGDVQGAGLQPGADGSGGVADAVRGADLVVTGEGAYDGQSAAGKVPSFVAGLAAEAGVPVGTVRSRVFYGLKALRLAMDEMGVEP